MVRNQRPRQRQPSRYDDPYCCDRGNGHRPKPGRWWLVRCGCRPLAASPALGCRLSYSRLFRDRYGPAPCCPPSPICNCPFDENLRIRSTGTGTINPLLRRAGHNSADRRISASYQRRSCHQYTRTDVAVPRRTCPALFTCTAIEVSHYSKLGTAYDIFSVSVLHVKIRTGLTLKPESDDQFGQYNCH